MAPPFVNSWRSQSGNFFFAFATATLLVGCGIIFFFQASSSAETLAKKNIPIVAENEPREAGVAELPASLHIKVTGLKLPDSLCQIAVFQNAKSFYRPAESVLWRAMTHLGGQANWQIEGLTPGQYAVLVFEDADRNGELSLNSFGVPTERYGFSNRSHERMGMPSFEDAKMSVRFAETTECEIALNRVSNLEVPRPPSTKPKPTKP